MFDYKKPCNDCPFRKGAGKLYGLHPERVSDILTKQDAFECHKTTGIRGPKRAPQQCAGVMSILGKEGRHNTIMQLASRLLGFDASQIDGSETYDSVADAIADHSDKYITD